MDAKNTTYLKVKYTNGESMVWYDTPQSQIDREIENMISTIKSKEQRILV